MTRLPHALPCALLAAPLALLAACGSPDRTPETTGNAAAPATDYAQRVRALPEGQRTAVFLRAIRDAGRDCQTVTEATEVTAQGGPATWSALCDNGARWVVAITPDGTATVVDQAALRGKG